MGPRLPRFLAAMVIAGAVAAPAWDETAIELEKELAPRRVRASE